MNHGRLENCPAQTLGYILEGNNFLKALQTLLHDSLLFKELDGEVDGVKDRER